MRGSADGVPDHRVPLAKGGSGDDANVRCLCAPGHRARTAEQFGYAGEFRPDRTNGQLALWGLRQILAACQLVKIRKGGADLFSCRQHLWNRHGRVERCVRRGRMKFQSATFARPAEVNLTKPAPSPPRAPFSLGLPHRTARGRQWSLVPDSGICPDSRQSHCGALTSCPIRERCRSPTGPALYWPCPRHG